MKMMLMKLAKKLAELFEIKDLGYLKYYLGMEVEHNKNGYLLHQTKYIEKLLEKFSMKDSKISDVPMNDGYFKQDSPKLENNTLYRAAIGSLLYLSNNSRPDIANAISLLSRKVTEPRKCDWTEVKRVLRYLKGTKNLKLKMYANENTNRIICYTDADWANDSSDRKSTSGFIITLNNCPIHWSSKKQNLVALSSTEAELISLVEAVKEVNYITKLLIDMEEEIKHVPKIYEDNQSTIQIIENDKYFGRTKHIDIKLKFTREYIKNGCINLEYIGTNEMVADILTKPLKRIKFNYLRSQMNLI